MEKNIKLGLILQSLTQSQQYSNNALNSLRIPCPEHKREHETTSVYRKAENTIEHAI